MFPDFKHNVSFCRQLSHYLCYWTNSTTNWHLLMYTFMCNYSTVYTVYAQYQLLPNLMLYSIFVFFIIYIQLKPSLSFSLPLQTSLLTEAWRTTAPRRWPGSLPPTQSPTSSARSPSPRLSFERDDHSWSPPPAPRDDQMTARPVIFKKFSQIKLDVNESTFHASLPLPSLFVHS